VPGGIRRYPLDSLNPAIQPVEFGKGNIRRLEESVFKDKQFSRREVLSSGARAGAFTILSSSALGRAGALPPSDKLNIAFIGIGITGWTNIRMLASQNIVALCDVDWRTPAALGARANDMAAATIQKYPDVKRYDDWRVMLDEMDKQIDAVVVSTSDHTHAVAALTAMKRGKHVYCEKPLAHNIDEVRAMMKAAKKYPHQATQTGFQGHASEDVRSIVEWVQNGAIGEIKEVHIFQQGGRRPVPGNRSANTAAPSSAPNAAPNGAVRPGGFPAQDQMAHINDVVPVPPEVKWDLWLGPAPNRNYNPMYIPLRWRNWLDFGTGILGDHGPHFFDPVVWSLDLGFPTSIVADTDAEYDPATNNQMFPRTATVQYDFPAKGNRGPVHVTWFGDLTPPIPDGWDPNRPLPDGGGIILGSKGSIVYGPVYSSNPGAIKQAWLVPGDLDKSYVRPAKTLPRPESHWLEWAGAAKAGRQPSGNWTYGGLVTQICLLGNVAIRLKGQKLLYDARTERFTNSHEANQLFARTYRKGWELPSI
jgi:predicted dehydrogenase